MQSKPCTRWKTAQNYPAYEVFKLGVHNTESCDCTYICSAPVLSAALALNVALADGDELRAVGENGALPRTKLLDNACPEMFELTGKFNA